MVVNTDLHYIIYLNLVRLKQPLLKQYINRLHSYEIFSYQHLSKKSTGLKILSFPSVSHARNLFIAMPLSGSMYPDRGIGYICLISFGY